jgi:hypothetical protein
MAEERQAASGSETAGTRMSSNYSPVKMIDTVGSAFLGILAVILLVALLRAQARNRALLAKLLEDRG